MLCELHLGFENYVEAALCVLLHADENYSWGNAAAGTISHFAQFMDTNNKPSEQQAAIFQQPPTPRTLALVTSLFSPSTASSAHASLQHSSPVSTTLASSNSTAPSEPSSIAKERLYHKAIHYFGQGKYWELGISLLQELRRVQQNTLRTPLQNLELERQYYLNIRYKDRFFEQYFFLEFFGQGFPQHLQVCSIICELLFHNELILIMLQNCGYVYRGKEAEKLGHFMTLVKERFPDAEMIHTDPTPEMLAENKQYLRIRTCKPSCMEECEGKPRAEDLNLPSPIRLFHRNTNVNVCVIRFDN